MPKTSGMIRIRVMVSLIGLVSWVGCTNEEEDINPSLPEEEVAVEPIGYLGVDTALWVYFERFEAEATRRGVFVDLRAERVTGDIEEIDEENTAGQCGFNRARPNELTVDAGFWRIANDRFREFIVFHELGHCVLYRSHREEADVYGICLSIMRSGTDDCRDNYNRFTRDAYLDELFDSDFRRDIFQ